MNLKNTLASMFVLSTLVFAGCDTTVQDGTTNLSLDLQPLVGTTPLVTGTPTYDINGRQTTIESARFYVSEITLLKSDGSETIVLSDSPLATVARDANGDDVPYTVAEEVVLAKHDLGQTVYELGEVESGDYSGIRFKVGLDGLTNKVDASQVVATNPLAIQTDRGNHWSWNSGYIFLRMDGQTDTDDDGTVDSRWEVHLGTGNFLETVTLNNAFKLEADEDMELQLDVDYAKFLVGLDYSEQANLLCHTMDNLPVAQIVSSNVVSAFSFNGTQKK